MPVQQQQQGPAAGLQGLEQQQPPTTDAALQDGLV
jgi:hypothetical protein